jgi:hypothetical protein
MTYTSIKVNMHKTLFYLFSCKKKSFYWPSLLHYKILPKQGYKSWGVTALPPLKKTSRPEIPKRSTRVV